MSVRVPRAYGADDLWSMTAVARWINDVLFDEEDCGGFTFEPVGPTKLVVFEHGDSPRYNALMLVEGIVTPKPRAEETAPEPIEPDVVILEFDGENAGDENPG